MYLEKLKLFGFKSFAKKTELQLLPGITAIVGPNGCGKSNIVDAIRWVLGEQKAGTLRTDRMESVIFNGSKTMKPLGMAEVSLVIQNTNNLLSVEYSEVVITRRLFRSGESQYLLNNQPCRLKDINDLLMDTGLAPDAYSVIELSMVEQILNGKPEDRRRIFEEAVGLTKYKQRRKLTFRKLDATEQDLLRIADIIGEVRSKVNSLHRQVRRAQRYQTISKNLQQAEIRVATYRFSRIYEELVPLNDKFEQSNRKRESLSSQISFKEAEVETIQTDLVEHEDKLREAQGRLAEIRQTIQKREEEVLLSRERLKSLDENKIRIQQEIENLKQQIEDRKKLLRETEARKTTTNEEIQKIQQEFEREKQELDHLDQLLNEKRTEARASEQQLLTLIQSISEKQRNLERLRAQLEHQNLRSKTLTQEKEQLRQQIQQDTQTHQQAKQKIDDLQIELDGIFETQAALELKSDNFQQEIETLKSSILKKQNQIDSTQQRIAFLKELLESYADYPEGVKYLMVNKGSQHGFFGALADVLNVEDEYRKAIEAALGEAATYLIVSDADTAYLGIESLSKDQRGVVTFLPINSLSLSKKERSLPDEPGVMGWANQLVQVENKFLPAVDILLGNYIVVDTIEHARNLVDHYPARNYQIVTKAGEMFYQWGGIRGGRKEAETESIIGRQVQLKELMNKEQRLQLELESDEKELKEKELERSEISQKMSATAQVIKELQDRISKQQIEISQIGYRIQQANENIKNIDAELKSIAENQAVIENQIQKLEPDLSHSSEKHSMMKDEIQTSQSMVEELEVKRRHQAEKVNQLNLKIVEIAGDERNLKQVVEQTENLLQQLEATIQARQNDLIENSRLKEELEVRIDELGELLSTDYSVKEKYDKRVEELEQKLRNLRDAIDKKSKIVKELRSERETISESLHETELRISELRIKADNMYRRIVDEYDWEIKREPIDPEYDVSVDEEEIEKFKERIKRLGPVNLLALKEYEKEKERLDFLEKQQEDLIEAEQNLKETIDHINKTAQERFDSIFLEIRTNFVKVFKEFFPNGEADLIIEDDGDPLEADIEIVANPKGKRMESLTLLSGGEKALTAISLLFGIYLVKPSPICILDEVDAPLDDNNVKRFLNTIKQFSSSTQFLMVTHNKLTMKAAHSLYGITMEESGVSKVVSVKLE